MRAHVRVHTDLLGTRIAGTALGLGFLLVGAYALFGGGDAVDPLLRERASGFGVAAIIGGVIAISVSWLVRRLDNIWCAPPRRGWFRAPRRDDGQGALSGHVDSPRARDGRSDR